MQVPRTMRRINGQKILPGYLLLDRTKARARRRKEA